MVEMKNEKYNLHQTLVFDAKKTQTEKRHDMKKGCRWRVLTPLFTSCHLIYSWCVDEEGLSNAKRTSMVWGLEDDTSSAINGSFSS
jgi:hypothetical protein